jgi:thiol-disulfide isomerase/thioredoxin
MNRKTIFLALPLAFAMLTGFIQSTDLSKALTSVRVYQNGLYQEASKEKNPNYDEIDQKIKAKANEVLKGIDVSKVSDKDALTLAELYQVAGNSNEACNAAERFLKTKPTGGTQFSAISIVLQSCAELGEADMLQTTLGKTRVAPEYSASLASSTIYVYIDPIIQKKGPEAALKTLNNVEKNLRFEDPKKYATRALAAEKKRPQNGSIPAATIGGAQTPVTDAAKLKKYAEQCEQMKMSTKWNFVDKRSELLIAMGKREEALAAINKFSASLAKDAPLLRSVNASKLRLEMTGNVAPTLAFAKSIGDFSSLADWKGKVVIIDFFAHWCGPCKASFPEVTKMYADLHDKGLEMVGVTRYYGFYQAERGIKPEAEFDKMIEFKKDFNLPYPIVFGENDNFSKYGVTGIPQSVIIDRKGNVHSIEIGYSPETFKKFRAEVEKLINE